MSALFLILHGTYSYHCHGHCRPHDLLEGVNIEYPEYEEKAWEEKKFEEEGLETVPAERVCSGPGSHDLEDGGHEDEDDDNDNDNDNDN